MAAVTVREKEFLVSQAYNLVIDLSPDSPLFRESSKVPGLR